MNVGWFNFCFEIWLMLYFKNFENIFNFKKCCEIFEKIFKENIGKKYKKLEEKIYNIFCENGNENKVI